MQPDRPGDAELRADRVVFEQGGKWCTGSLGVFLSRKVLKELVALEIRQAVAAERQRWEKELVHVLESLYRSELRRGPLPTQMMTTSATDSPI